ncbi:MAG: NUDIX domain-containing protein [Bacteroidales bacterium]|jgi:8-oxo-dGTP pyrophosphatase MutT (NUDIX family)|nr:NUDIX domain-containing protein [Bacteroidales bacterium]
MYKIFYEQRALIFPNIDEKDLILDATAQQSESYEVEKIHNFLRQWLVVNLTDDVVIDHVSPEVLSAALCRTFYMAPAAGGVVVQEGQFAAIQRHGIPDLPKGHVEEGEDIATAAIREVEEETGLMGLKIIRQLPSSWHCYLYEDEWRLKQTSWFLMTADDTSHTNPQTDEDITEVTFLSEYDLEWFLKNTYRSIAETLESELKTIIS